MTEIIMINEPRRTILKQSVKDFVQTLYITLIKRIFFSDKKKVKEKKHANIPVAVILPNLSRPLSSEKKNYRQPRAWLKE